MYKIVTVIHWYVLYFWNYNAFIRAVIFFGKRDGKQRC
jgi:hypothetical protein